MKDSSLDKQFNKKGSKFFKHYRPSGIDPRYLSAVSLPLRKKKVSFIEWFDDIKDAFKSMRKK